MGQVEEYVFLITFLKVRDRIHQNSDIWQLKGGRSNNKLQVVLVGLSSQWCREI